MKMSLQNYLIRKLVRGSFSFAVVISIMMVLMVFGKE